MKKRRKRSKKKRISIKNCRKKEVEEVKEETKLAWAPYTKLAAFNCQLRRVVVSDTPIVVGASN